MKKMKNGFLMVAIATLFFASCQKDTGSNNATSGANTNKKVSKIGNFSTIDANGNEVFTSADWADDYDYNLNPNGTGWWKRFELGQCSYSFNPHAPAYNYSSFNAWTTTVDPNIVQKCRVEKKYPWYIVNPATTAGNFTQDVHLGGTFNLPKFRSGSTTEYNTGACIMQALEANSAPVVMVVARPNSSYIRVYYFSSRSVSNYFDLPYTRWGNNFKIELSIQFTNNQTNGYIYATLTDDLNNVVTNSRTGISTFYSEVSDVSPVGEGISWSAGCYSDYEKPISFNGSYITQESAVYLTSLFAKGHSHSVRVKNSHKPDPYVGAYIN